MAKIIGKDVTLPYLRIEYSATSARGRYRDAVGGFGCLMLGKTVINEIALLDDPTGQLAVLVKLAEAVNRELGMVKIDGTATKISVMIPADQNPVILWPK